MKKAAIVTINSLNFGNRLQNYALQRSLQHLGFETETIRRNNYVWDDTSFKERIQDVIRYILNSRKGAYLRFDRKYISYSRYMGKANSVDPGMENAYDYFVVGSDQVWNPHYDYMLGTTDLLLFTEGAKRVSYAASFGVETIPDEKKELFGDALKDYKAISVREASGVRIVKELCGREAKLVLDPTLLLNTREWDRVVRKPAACPEGRYILVYVIGDISAETQGIIDGYREKTGCTVFNVLGRMKNGKEVAAGPSEFLWLVKNADLIVTDSFHCTVFSILYHKKIRSVNRNGMDMSSRVRSLAKTAGLEDHFEENGVFYMNGDENYTQIEKQLNKARKQSLKYLRNALS